ncbi:MAG: alcohol dehydrogenase catalytic domain-containing protein [Actinomycetota bacterium]
MRAVVYEEPGRIAVGEVAEPAIEDPRDAIVRVTLAAICGSDLHFFHGKAPMDPGETIGHEAVGVVEAVGGAVARFAVGDRVVVAFDNACGACWFCRSGQTQLCEDFRTLGAGAFGGGLGGAQADLVRIPYADANLLAIPAGLDDERALFLGDILTTGLYGASVPEIRPGETVAVVGAGPVGFFAAQAARLADPAAVLVLDRDPARLAIAASVGAAPIDVGARHAQMAVAEATEGRGADVVIEAVGTPEAFESAIDVVRRGGRVSVVGMFTSESISIPLGIWWARSLDVRFAGICPVHAWWERALAAVADGRIDPTPIVSHRMGLDDAVEGYALFAAREATKVVLRP